MEFVRRSIVLAVLIISFVTPFALCQCVYQGRSYNSAEQLPSDDPCEFCMCYQDHVICLSQPCPPPAEGCQEVLINGFCCPRYDCGPYDISLSGKNTSVAAPNTNALVPGPPLDLQDRNDPRSDKAHSDSAGQQQQLPLPLLRASKR